MPKSQQDNYQSSTIWSCRKIILRKKIPRNIYQEFSTFRDLSWPTKKQFKKANNNICPY